MRSLPFFWFKLESMWSQVHWADGKHEDIEEDYSPWVSVKELLDGHFATFDSRFDRDGTFEAARVTGPERDRLWAHLEHGRAPSRPNDAS